MLRGPWTSKIPQTGDWLCPCNRINPMQRDMCSTCSRLKPMQPLVVGRWVCRMCAMYNDETRKVCWECKMDRPSTYKPIVHRIVKSWQCSKAACRRENLPEKFRCVKCGTLKNV